MRENFESRNKNNSENQDNNQEGLKPISEYLEEEAEKIKGLSKEEAIKILRPGLYEIVKNHIERQGKKKEVNQEQSKKTQEEPSKNKAESQKSKEEAELQDALGRNRKDINDLYNR